MKKRVLSILLIVMLLVTAFPVSAQGFDTQAGVAALMEASTGQFLFLKNADERRPPASITKIMTLLLAFEALERGDIKWDQTTTVSERAYRILGSEMFLDINTQVTVEDLISGISIVSANDGCIAIAELMAGSEEAFVQRMNIRAQELGLKNTLFKNTTGLPAEGHYMSARDIAIIARELITKHPRILEFESQREFTYNNIKQYNRNPLLGRFLGADGLKTGWTPESGHSLAGTAVQNNMRLISVVLNATSDNQRAVASQELLNYGFRNFGLVTKAKTGDKLAETTIKDARTPIVPLTIPQDLVVLAPQNRDQDIKLVVTDEKQLTAPVAKGTQAATLLVQLDGETIATTPLVTAEAAQRANIIVRLFRGIVGFVRGLIGR